MRRHVCVPLTWQFKTSCRRGTLVPQRDTTRDPGMSTGLFWFSPVPTAKHRNPHLRHGLLPLVRSRKRSDAATIRDEQYEAFRSITTLTSRQVRGVSKAPPRTRRSGIAPNVRPYSRAERGRARAPQDVITAAYGRGMRIPGLRIVVLRVRATFATYDPRPTAIAGPPPRRANYRECHGLQTIESNSDPVPCTAPPPRHATTGASRSRRDPRWCGLL